MSEVKVKSVIKIVGNNIYGFVRDTHPDPIVQKQLYGASTETCRWLNIGSLVYEIVPIKLTNKRLEFLFVNPMNRNLPPVTNEDMVYQIAEAFKELARRIAKVLASFCRWLGKTWRGYVRRDVPARLYGLAYHAKKSRTRKKNLNRINKLLFHYRV